MIDWRGHINIDPEIMYGKPVIKGTRIPVDLIMEKLSNGETPQELQEAYPMVKSEDIFACLAYARDLIRNEEVYLLAS